MSAVTNHAVKNTVFCVQIPMTISESVIAVLRLQLQMGLIGSLALNPCLHHDCYIVYILISLII